jgi:hypothetical protein
MIHRDLGQHALEAGTVISTRAALALILVDDEDTLGRPAQGLGEVG